MTPMILPAACAWPKCLAMQPACAPHINNIIMRMTTIYICWGATLQDVKIEDPCALQAQLRPGC